MSKSWLVGLVGLVIILVIGFLDYKSGSELAFSLFYIGPIYFTVWFLGINQGWFFIILSALVWLVADLAGGREYSNELIPIWNTVIRLFVFGIVAYLVHKVKQLLAEEEYHADIDVLTSLYNRRAFLERLESEINRAKRYGGSFSLAYIDLDNFKLVNDNLGHDVGDQLLVTVAKGLAENTRNTDIVARLGGDEFAAFFPSSSKDSTAEILNKLRNEMQAGMDDKDWPVTFSIGAVTFYHTKYSISEMLKTVDELMYKVKKQGKNGLIHQVVDV